MIQLTELQFPGNGEQGAEEYRRLVSLVEACRTPMETVMPSGRCHG
jgi:hypothetical protein